MSRHAMAAPLRRAAARVAAPSPRPAAPAALRHRLGAGEHLPADIRAYFEPRFGADLGAVRLHRDRAGAEAAAAVGADAFALGPHIAFAEGSFAPQGAAGRLLLGHELAHVVQQRRGGGGDAGDAAAEHDARRAATAAAQGGAAVVLAARGHGFACQEASEEERRRRNVGLANRLYTSFLGSSLMPEALKQGVEGTNEWIKQEARRHGFSDEAQQAVLADVVQAVGPETVQAATAVVEPPPALAPPPQPVAEPKTPPPKGSHRSRAFPVAKRTTAGLPRVVRTISVKHFGLFGSGGYVIGQAAEPTIQYEPDPTAGMNFDTYIVVLDDNARTIPAISLGGTRYRVFMGSAECTGCHLGHGLEVDIGGENPIIATLPPLLGLFAGVPAGEAGAGATTAATDMASPAARGGMFGNLARWRGVRTLQAGTAAVGMGLSDAIPALEKGATSTYFGDLPALNAPTGVPGATAGSPFLPAPPASPAQANFLTTVPGQGGGSFLTYSPPGWITTAPAQAVQRLESAGAWGAAQAASSVGPDLQQAASMGFLDPALAAPGANVATASARTARSVTTAIRAQTAEVSAYEARMVRGEIGLLAPSGSNVPGADYATAVRLPNGDYEIVVADAKSRVSAASAFGQVRTSMPSSWQNAVSAALAPGRLGLGDPAIEQAIRDAWAQGRVRIARDTIDYSVTGQGGLRLDN